MSDKKQPQSDASGLTVIEASQVPEGTRASLSMEPKGGGYVIN